jgi:cytochrome c biogenesis protein CcdA
VIGDLGFAMAAGSLAAVNPCGFAMLPAYLPLAVDGPGNPTTRALRAGSAMTAGFLTVFGVVGLVVAPATSAVQRVTPALTVVIGVRLLWVGLRQVAGRSSMLHLPWWSAAVGPGAGGMYCYGVTYAIASLGCTLAPFLVAVGAGLTDDPMRRVVSLAAYGFGMGLVALVAATATAAGGRPVLDRLRGLGRAGRFTGAVLLAVGG